MTSAAQSNGQTAKPVTIVVVGAGSRGTVSLPRIADSLAHALTVR